MAESHTVSIQRPQAAGLALGIALLALAGLFAVVRGSLADTSLPDASWSGWDQAFPGPTTPYTGSLGSPRVLAQSEDGITIELQASPFEVQWTNDDLGPCARLVLSGYGTAGGAAMPELPAIATMVGIPSNAQVTMQILDVQAVPLPDRYVLCPVPSVRAELDPSGETIYRGFERIRDAAAYARDGSIPAVPAELGDSGTIRSQHVVQVRFYPFQYYPRTGRVLHLQRIRIHLAFTPDKTTNLSTPGSVDEGIFEDPLRILANYDQAREWRTLPTSQDAGASSSLAPGPPALKILVDADGLYQVTFEDLHAAADGNLDPIDAFALRLTNQGQEVAILVEGSADGRFGPGDAILFFGQQARVASTRINVYWLTWTGAAGPRMTSLDGTPDGTAGTPAHFAATQVTEQDLIYQSNLPCGPDGDRWYWGLIYANGAPSTASYTITLPALSQSPVSATLRGGFMGYAATALQGHHTQVYLNGHRVHDAYWSPQTEYEFEVEVPQSFLVEGTNAISITSGSGIASGEQDVVLVDEFQVDYFGAYKAGPGAFFFQGDQAGSWEFRVGGLATATVDLLDITVPTAPVRILGAAIQGSSTYTASFQQAITEEHRYLVTTPAQRRLPLAIQQDTPSDLRSTANGADYVIITHADFYTAVLPLAERRAAQGLRVIVVDVQDAYDEFSYGLFDPKAIHDMLAYAYANWTPPAPAYVLLVGDGHYDFKDNLKRGEVNYIPPYLADVDPWKGETAADNRYVCVSGADYLPDMHLGRLPVKSAAEASALVSKILAYESAPPGGEWNQQMLFVADDADDGGDFAAASDAIVNQYVPAPYQVTRIYYGITHPTIDGARAAIKQGFNAGNLLVSYVGHGGFSFWASEQLFTLRDAKTLSNGGMLPFIVPMTCLEGYYIIPSPAGRDMSSLGEGVVREADKGAIASWSPTGLGDLAPHDTLERGLFTALFDEDITQIGPATTWAKVYLFANSAAGYELLDTYVLMGDPAMRLNVLKPDLAMAQSVSVPDLVGPGDPITYTLAYSNIGAATAHQVVIRDTLPPLLLNPNYVSSGTALQVLQEGPFAWDAGDLAPGAGGTITITALIDPAFSGTISNTAVITSSTPDDNLANNTAGPLWASVERPYRFWLPLVTDR